MSAELSICIPTRNRAPFLQKCLSHLKGFSRLRLEVIVSDNASEDATPNVARGFEKGAFERFLYHRHREDVGVARNMDAALRLAGAPYVWILSDDDIAYEGALVFLRQLLERTPAAVAACGGYASVRAMNVGADRFQAPASGGGDREGRSDDAGGERDGRRRPSGDACARFSSGTAGWRSAASGCCLCTAGCCATATCSTPTRTSWSTSPTRTACRRA